MTYISDILGMNEIDRLEIRNVLFDCIIKRDDMKAAKEMNLETNNPFSIKG